MGNDGNFTKIPAGQPKGNVSLVTKEPAAIVASLLDIDVNVMSKHNQIQETDHQCTVRGRSTEHVSLVDKLSDVQNSLDLVSHKTNQRTTLGSLPIDEKDKNMSTGDAQLDRTNSTVAGNIVAESGRNKPSKSSKNTTAGDARINGMVQGFPLTHPTPSAVKSVHRPSAQTLPDPRIYRTSVVQSQCPCI